MSCPSNRKTVLPLFIPTVHASSNNEIVVSPAPLFSTLPRPDSCDEESSRKIDAPPVNVVIKTRPKRQREALPMMLGTQPNKGIDRVSPLPRPSRQSKKNTTEISPMTQLIYGGNSIKATTKQGSNTTLQRLQMEQIRTTQQEERLIHAMDARINHIGRAILPLSFLQTHQQHHAFAERVILHSMCTILNRYYSHISYTVFYHWKTRTLTLRILQDQQRQSFILRQTTLAHVCALIQHKIRKQLHQRFKHWYEVTSLLRETERQHCAIMIQRIWRSMTRLRQLQQMTREYYQQIRNKSAIKIQCILRKYLARLVYLQIRETHEREIAVRILQRGYRQYRRYRMAREQLVTTATIVIQRYWRGTCGRQRVRDRRAMCRHVCTIMYTTQWESIALDRVHRAHEMASCIQHCIRTYFYRQKICYGMNRAYQRRHCWFVSLISQTWKTYRLYTIQQTLNGMIIRIAMTHLTAVRRIQYCFRAYWKRKRHHSSCLITRLMRRYQAKRVMMSHILKWLEQWESHVWTHWIQMMRPQSKWVSIFSSCRDEMTQFRTEQLNGTTRLHVRKGLYVIQTCRTLEKNYIMGRVQEIQRIWRLYHFHIVLSQQKQAIQVLQRALPRLVHSYQRQCRRYRVLSRWKAKRYIVLHECFQQWKALHIVHQETRDLTRNQLKVRRAKWFRYDKLRKRMLQQWKFFRDVQQYKTKRWKMATTHSIQRLESKIWQAWTQQALPQITCYNILQQLGLLLHVWKQWQDVVIQNRQLKQAQAHANYKLKQHGIQQWKQDYQSFKQKILKARIYRNTKRLIKCLYGWKKQVMFMKQVIIFSQSKQKRYGIRQWIFKMCLIRQSQAWTRHSQSFYQHHLFQSHWIQWRRYLDHQKKQQEKRYQMEQYYRKRRLHQLLSHWHLSFVPMWKDWKWCCTLATLYYTRKLKQYVFQKGWIQFWAITIGKKRIEMAIRIQRIYRGKRARKRILYMRLKLEYQYQTRWMMTSDIETFESSRMFLERIQHSVWTFLLLSFPWQPLDSKRLEMYSKTATTWKFLRHQMVMFGQADATMKIRCEAHETEYSLMSWLGVNSTQLPCVVALWQGTGPCLPQAAGVSLVKARQQRYKRVCGENAQPSVIYPFQTTTTMSMLVEWIEQVQQNGREAAAIDIQAHIRGFLLRRHMKRYRILKYQGIQMRVRDWITNLRWKHTTTVRTHAAIILQQWIRKNQDRRLFWTRLQHELDTYRKASQVIQRLIRKHTRQQRLQHALISLRATPERYPDAPICEECMNQKTLNELVLARLHCRDCQQAYCTECFLTTHKSAKRMQHLSDTIDFIAMNDPKAFMCTICRVQGAIKVCSTCNGGLNRMNRVSEDPHLPRTAFCIGCFEQYHSTRTLRWWESETFKTHQWERLIEAIRVRGVDGIATPLPLDASTIFTTHHYQNYRQIKQQRQVVEQTEQAKQMYEIGIRLQHEMILRDVFNAYDQDHSGTIDRMELKQMLREELCLSLTDQQVEQAIQAMDHSGNGLIEFHELLEWFLQTQSKDSNILLLLKEAFQAKKRIRQYKNKLSELIPSKSIRWETNPLTLMIEPIRSRPRTKVPGFPTVDCIQHSDFSLKRRIFYRFLYEMCHLTWIYEDEKDISLVHALEMYDQVFVPRWNQGLLTYDYYFDEESFEYEQEQWQRRWDSNTHKYKYHTIRKYKRPETNEEYEIEIIETIDPRRKQLLREQAHQAFSIVDVDGSGTIDSKELYRMLTCELCEPISKTTLKQVMRELDVDGNGTIDFNEFFQWYASEKCQDYPVTAQTERIRTLLKTKQRAKETMMGAWTQTISNGIKLHTTFKQKQQQQQLRRDCKGASCELIVLLQQGYSKQQAEKALLLHNQDVVFARHWLEERQHEQHMALQEELNRRMDLQKEAQIKALKRREKFQNVTKRLHVLLFGPNKKQAHNLRLEQALGNLDRELIEVENEMKSKRSRREK